MLGSVSVILTDRAVVANYRVAADAAEEIAADDIEVAESNSLGVLMSGAE